MQCNQLLRLVKNWYTHVKQETMAPARMMQFIENHVKECTICQRDNDLVYEIEKIREYVLPESQFSKMSRSSQSALTPDIFPTVEKEEDSDSVPPKNPTADGLP